jgi:hypothetical protein
VWNFLEPCKRVGQIAGSRRANVAEILSDDQVGLQRAEQFGINRIESLAGGEDLAHLRVDLRRVRAGIHARFYQHRLPGRFRREIAFVRYAHHRITKPQRKQHFGSRRKQ